MYNAIIRIRVIATLIIVAYHCACPYFNYSWDGYYGNIHPLSDVLQFIFIRILCYTMLPTFFLISGMLFYGRKEVYCDLKKTFWKKFERLAIPYALIYTLCSVLPIPDIGVAGFSGHIWFVKILFFFFCVAIIFYKVKESYLFSVAAVCFCVFVLHGRLALDLSEDLLYFTQYFLFFVGGHYAAKYYDRLHQVRFWKWLFLVLWGLALVVNQQTISTLLFNVVLLSFVPSFPVESKFLTLINSNSFCIYLLHHILFFALFTVPSLNELYCKSALFALPIMYLIVLSLSLGMSMLLKKIGFNYF